MGGDHLHTFTKNRERVFSEAIMREFFGKALAQWKQLVSDEHFSADGTLIEAWASMKSFVSKDGSGKGYDTADFVQAMREAKVTPHVAAKKTAVSPERD